MHLALAEPLADAVWQSVMGRPDEARRIASLAADAGHEIAWTCRTGPIWVVEVLCPPATLDAIDGVTGGD